MPGPRPFTGAGVLVSSAGLTDLRDGSTTRLTSPGHQGATTAAVPSADGSQVLYSSFHFVTPVDGPSAAPDSALGASLRLLTRRPSAGSTDVLVSPSAADPTLSGTGRLAYLALEPPAGEAPTATDPGRVTVRASPTGDPIAWTGTGSYDVLAWAGSHLLVADGSDDDGDGRLLALDGPGSSHALATGPTTLAAVSPDGGTVLVKTPPLRDTNGGLALLDVTDGSTAGTVDVSAAGPAGLGYPTAGGSWDGDRLVLSFGNQLGVFTWAGRRLTLTTLLFVPPEVAPFAYDPWFSDDHRRVLALSVPGADQGADPQADSQVLLVSCEVATGVCGSHLLTVPVDGLARLSNPSRPVAPTLPEEQH